MHIFKSAPVISSSHMSVIYKMKLRQIADSLMVAIPRPICNAQGWKAGDDLEVLANGTVVLRKAASDQALPKKRVRK